MGNDIRKKVDFPLYLEVLKQLPEVMDEDVAETKKVFEAIYGKVPDEITFDVGGKKGDGEIFAFQRITDEAGRSYRSKLYIDEYGNIENKDTGYEGKIPFLVARYFITSLFGTGELEETEEFFFKSNKLEGMKFSAPVAGDPKENKFNPNTDSSLYIKNKLSALLIPHIGALAEGANELYGDAVKKGSMSATTSSGGMEAIEGVKALVMAQLHMITQEVWKDAETMLQKAESGPDFWGPEEIKATIDKNAEMKPETPPLTYEQAKVMYEAAVKMMRDIAATKAGEHYFKENHCKTTVEDEKFTVYKCEYGVHGGKGFFVQETNPFK